MTLRRHCDCCNATLPGHRYIELSARVLDPNGAEVQDAISEAHGDYCADCLSNGRAVQDLQDTLGVAEGSR
jgi:hypothetical protein